MKHVSIAIPPAEGRKALSQSRKVDLPITNFENSEYVEMPINRHPLTTPIGRTLRNGQHNQSTETLESQVQRPVKFRIYLSRVEYSKDFENGVDLTVDGGSKTNTKDLCQILSNEYEIEYAVFKEAFAIWMISPLLEIQLKPHHRPYDIRKGWVTLLNRFGDKDFSNRFGNDEPILMMRRNVNLTAEREHELLESNPIIASFLITDARESIFLSRMHFLSIDDLIRATALIFCLQHGNFDEKCHDVPFVRSKIEEILPEKLCESICAKTIFGKSINKKTNNEEKLINSWKQVSNIKKVEEKEQTLLKTLAETSSCYGSAWFSAIVERKTSRVNLRNFGSQFAEAKVKIGINDRWITIVDASSNDVLLIQNIEEMSWQLETTKEETPKDVPQSFLVFNLRPEEKITNGNDVNIEVAANDTLYFLMVLGEQTVLIDALLQTFFGWRMERQSSQNSESSCSDSSTSSGRHSILIQSKLAAKDCATMNNRKLCLAKFQNGLCTEVAGSFKNVYSHGQPYE